MADHWMKVGDVLPEVFSTLTTVTDGVRLPTHIFGADVQFIMRNIETGEVMVDAPATNLDDDTEANRGTVSYTWVLGDTDVAGGYFAEWLVTYGSGDEETFPDDDYKRIAILERLVAIPS